MAEAPTTKPHAGTSAAGPYLATSAAASAGTAARYCKSKAADTHADSRWTRGRTGYGARAAELSSTPPPPPMAGSSAHNSHNGTSTVPPTAETASGATLCR